MQHSFIAFAGGAGFVGIDSGNQNQLVLDFFIDSGQSADIVADGLFIVGRTGTDDDQEFAALSGEYVFDLGVSFLFQFHSLCRHGIFLTNIFRGGKFRYISKRHKFSPLVFMIIFFWQKHLHYSILF